MQLSALVYIPNGNPPCGPSLCFPPCTLAAPWLIALPSRSPHISLHAHFLLLIITTTRVLVCLVAMSCLSSPLTPKRQLKLPAAVTALLVVVFFALLVGSCEARRLRACGSVGSIKPTSPPTPYKDAASMKLHGSDPTNQKKDLSSTSMDGHMTSGVAKAEGVAAIASPGGVQTMIVVRVSKRLSHQERRVDTAFHLDYAGPRTHPPSHN